jgi:tetratricopeptide (TPR) repeat protein
LQQETIASVSHAIDQFNRAVTIDPEFALAWVGAAESLYALKVLTGKDSADRLERAEAAVDRALRLDKKLGEAHTALATILAAKGDMSGAEEALERALLLNANYAKAHFQHGLLLQQTGRLEQSLSAYEKAVRLDPLSPSINDGYAYALTEIGRFDEALGRYQKLLEIDPDYPFTGVGVGTIYGLAYGRLDLAYDWYQRALPFDPQSPFLSSLVALVYLEVGDDEKAEHWVRRALALSPEHAWALGAMVMLQSYLGNADELRRYAEQVSRAQPRWRFGTALSHDRIQDMRDRNYEVILERYEASFPELFADVPDVNPVNFRPAIDIAGVRLAMGEHERANALLARCLEQIQRTARVGYGGFWISDVQIHALKGETRQALAALRQAIDQGWRTDWRYFFFHDPNLDSIRDTAEFQSMQREIADDMAGQLARIRDAEANSAL